MYLYIEVLMQYSEACATCGKVLDKGDKAYIQVNAHYNEKLTIVETATCLECKGRNLGKS